MERYADVLNLEQLVAANLGGPCPVGSHSAPHRAVAGVGTPGQGRQSSTTDAALPRDGYAALCQHRQEPPLPAKTDCPIRFAI